MLRVICFCLSLVVLKVSGFPDGAPTESCAKHRPNHGATAQPIKTLPFNIQASASTYKNNEPVAVRISGKQGVYFKGFFLQAMNENGEWIGNFEPTPFSVSHPECSMTTHSENHEKEEVTLIWYPPQDSEGNVYFLASIIKNYKMYWVDIPVEALDRKNA